MILWFLGIGENYCNGEIFHYILSSNNNFVSNDCFVEVVLVLAVPDVHLPVCSGGGEGDAED